MSQTCVCVVRVGPLNLCCSSDTKLYRSKVFYHVICTCENLGSAPAKTRRMERRAVSPFSWMWNTLIWMNVTSRINLMAKGHRDLMELIRMKIPHKRLINNVMMVQPHCDVIISYNNTFPAAIQHHHWREREHFQENKQWCFTAN